MFRSAVVMPTDQLMKLRYDLEDNGWARVILKSAGQRVVMRVSYLSNSLRDLSTATRTLINGASEASVVFMDEPGEHELIMRQKAPGVVEMEVLWYPEWKSWHMYDGQGTRRIFFQTTLLRVRDQVLSEMKRLLAKHGESGYRKKWIEHRFPTAAMKTLENAGA